MSPASKIFVGTAAWAVPSAAGNLFSEGKSHLERYSGTLHGVEINTSFYRDHKPQTYEKWAQMTPAGFRFAVKLSRVFTHDQALVVEEEDLRRVLEAVMRLGDKLAVLLIQLPPKLAFKEAIARQFFKDLRSIYQGSVVVEPRHKTWLSPGARSLFEDYRLTKVIADPDPCPTPEGFPSEGGDVAYFRWHGSPVIYETRYETDELERLRAMAVQAQEAYREVWIIFDNTTYGWATVNALEMKNLLKAEAAFVPRSSDLEGHAN